MKARSLPRITQKQLVSARNDEVRDALNILGRHVTPIVDADAMYLTDLMYDACNMAEMHDEETAYIVVTDVGTYWRPSRERAQEAFAHTNSRAILKVVCTKPRSRYLSRTWRISKEH